MTDLFKEIIPSILQNKKNVLENEKDYHGFVVNRALSFHYDCVMQANEMNRFPGLDNKMQYDYLLNCIRGYKRKFQPWQKKIVIENLEIIKEYYGYSNEKAKDVLHLLSEEQIGSMKKFLDKGGTKK